jgi:hypothetical protein
MTALASCVLSLSTAATWSPLAAPMAVTAECLVRITSAITKLFRLSQARRRPGRRVAAGPAAAARLPLPAVRCDGADRAAVSTGY